MEYRFLGYTGIKVSRLCFGALTISPLQANLPLNQGIDVILQAVDMGVNFIDTAELYNNYEYIKGALNYKKDLIICSKSYAYDKKTAEESLEFCLKSIGRDYVDIFMIHEQESELTLKGHYQAINYLVKQKQLGKVRAVGISTHTVAAVKAAKYMPEIDIIQALINIEGLGIQDGTVKEMEEQLQKAKYKGKGIYGMKPLGGGNLIKKYETCLKYVINLDFLDSIALGMQSKEEVIANVFMFEGKKPTTEVIEKISAKKRKVLVDFWCQACGKCVQACSQNAITIKDGRASINRDKCLICGYCGAFCPEFCIKII